MTTLPFATDLPTVTREDWLKLLEGVLKGVPYDKKMVTPTYEGLALDALPPRKPAAPILAGRAAAAPWTISMRVDQPDLTASNAQALEDLDGGASGLSLVFATSPQSYGFGLPNGADLDAVLKGVMLDLIETRLELGGFTGRENALAFAALAETRGLDPKAVKVSFGLNPMGSFALMGHLPMSWSDLAKRFCETSATLADKGFAGTIARAEGSIFHEAGASDAQELAAVLATAVAYLKIYTNAGVPLEEAARRIEVSLVADVNQTATIAKFRAIRLLWGAVLRECGLPAKPLTVHGTTAWRSMTRRDPYVNLLRATVAAFAAGVGGADSVTVLPFTQTLGLPDAFARRLARNTQVMLIEESNVHRVADPAAGAGAVEAHTDGLAEKAWDLFRTIEHRGGLIDVLTDRWLQGEIAEVKARRDKDVATRKAPITGTSEFPILVQEMPEVLAPLPAAAPVADGALGSYRTAEPFEDLRNKAEAAAPKVFLATLGPVAAFTARATFAKNFFEAGGISAAVPDGFADLDALVAAFKAAGTPFACLASSDEVYGTDAAAAAKALKAAGAGAVWLAGKPTAIEAELKAAGVDGFIFVGCNVLETLAAAQAAAGLK
ncbi:MULTISPECIES: methylmalonyl-CoA mutase family protein [unclassified Xanthobacter]|uniref:methylmalonyl-CoA mutase family protein n=1 Tax=unclassified Xanthobacter TaxID=2623496 RepID=UPI001F45B09E|nr:MULTISPECIES: methylmalonyl-CoA mutase family protein [unclassified Xanthobacter]